MLKRVFDIAFALCALLISAPVLVAVVVWIKLDSRGSVLFRQERVGEWDAVIVRVAERLRGSTV